MSYALQSTFSPSLSSSVAQLSPSIEKAYKPSSYKPLEADSLLENNLTLWTFQVVVKACLELEDLPERHSLLAYVCFSLPSQKREWPITEAEVKTSSSLLGSLVHWRYEAVESLIEELLAQGYLTETRVSKKPETESIVLTPTEKGFALAKGFYLERHLVLEKQAAEVQATPTLIASTLIETVAEEPSQPATQHAQLRATACFENPAEQALFDELRAYRWQLALKEQVRAYRVCSNAVLEAMVKEKPTTLPALERLHGVGEKFITHYGQGFISKLAQ
jgi:superfamily II DNA helicase RecQ